MLDKLSRRRILKLGAIAATGLLAGCAPKIVKETVIVEKPAEKIVEKVVKETVVVEVEVEVDKVAQMRAELKAEMKWDTFRGLATGWNEERISTFGDMFPNVTIEFRPMVSPSQQESYGKYYALWAAGDLGDICAFDPSHYQFWRAIDKGLLLPLTDLADADDLDTSEWFDAFITMQYYKGQLYGLPSWGWTGYDCFVTNFKHFEELGIEAPDPKTHDTSMDTIAEYAETFRVESGGKVERFGLALAGGDAGVTVLTRAFGGELIDSEGLKSMLLEDEALEALKWAYDLNVTRALTPKAGELTGGNQGAWAAGKLSLYHCGSLCVINANKAIVDKELATIGQIGFPKNKNGQVPSQLRGGTWNVSSKTKSPQAAYEFVKHIAGKDGTIGFNLVGGNGAMTRADVLPILAASNPLYEWFYDTLRNGMVIHAPANSRGREYTDICGQYWAKLMDPETVIPFEQGVQEMSDEVQKILDMDPA